MIGMMAPMERLAQIEQLAREYITEHGLGQNHEHLAALHTAIYRGTCKQEIAEHADPEIRDGERTQDDGIYNSPASTSELYEAIRREKAARDE